MVQRKYPISSLFTWYPLVKDIMNTPKTVMIPLTKWFEDTENIINGGRDPVWDKLLGKAEGAADGFGYPVFLRSDEASNKHDWLNSCFIQKKEDVARGIRNILEFTEMVFFGLSFKGVVVREFLKLKTGFHAFSGMPIAREFRFFVREGDVLCMHPYWPPAAIRRADREDWLPVLRKMSRIDDVEETLLRTYSREIAQAVKGVNPPHDFWSIDFCETADGYWYLTDMARGEDSYHWGTCPNVVLGDHPNFDDPEDISEATTLKQEEEEMKAFNAKYGRHKDE